MAASEKPDGQVWVDSRLPHGQLRLTAVRLKPTLGSECVWPLLPPTVLDERQRNESPVGVEPGAWGDKAGFAEASRRT